MSINVGDRVLRGVQVISDNRAIRARLTKVLTEHTFAKDARGQSVFRAIKDGQNLVVDTEGQRGIVCFCSEPIPEGWTHFVVTAALKDGACGRVTPVVGHVEELFSMFGESVTTQAAKVLKLVSPSELMTLVGSHALANGLSQSQVRELLDAYWERKNSAAPEFAGMSQCLEQAIGAAKDVADICNAAKEVDPSLAADFEKLSSQALALADNLIAVTKKAV